MVDGNDADNNTGRQTMTTTTKTTTHYSQTASTNKYGAANNVLCGNKGVRINTTDAKDAVTCVRCRKALNAATVAA